MLCLHAGSDSVRGGVDRIDLTLSGQPLIIVNIILCCTTSLQHLFINMIDKKARITISIPEYHYRELRKWAFVKGRGVATMASDILQARIEANLGDIEKMIKSRAKDMDLDPEDLISDILGDNTENTIQKPDKCPPQPN